MKPATLVAFLVGCALTIWLLIGLDRYYLDCAHICARRGMAMEYRCEHPDLLVCMCRDRSAR